MDIVMTGIDHVTSAELTMGNPDFEVLIEALSPVDANKRLVPPGTGNVSPPEAKYVWTESK